MHTVATTKEFTPWHGDCHSCHEQAWADDCRNTQNADNSDDCTP